MSERLHDDLDVADDGSAKGQHGQRLDHAEANASPISPVTSSSPT